MSSTSLYGSTGNVTVSANNLTTLYNATGGTVVTANVPDRNFTTLYATTQSQVLPTKPYGNANVEAFLNSGTDGANTVQNINMSGALTVGGVSNLGPVGNVIITGGSSGYVLTTNGLGNLIWAEGTGGGGNTVPYIHFDVSSTGNNQTFTNNDIGFYSDANSMAVMKNGVNIEPSLYSKSGNVLTVNILLNTGDTVDVLPSGGGGGGLPAGAPNSVQYNNGYTFAGDSAFTFNDTTKTLFVDNINTGELVVANAITSTDFIVSGTATLPTVGNVHISGGSNGQVLTTNGSGNLTWANVGGSTYIQNGNSNVSIPSSNGNVLISVNGTSNVITISNNTTTINTATSISGNVTITNTLTIQEGIEKVTANTTGSTGTINYDILTQAILNKTANATASFNINVRGNSSVTLDSVMATDQSMTCTYINKKGATPYVMSLFQIDGATRTVYWLNGTNPTTNAYTYDIYTFNILKTASNTYTVFGNFGSYS